MSLFVTASCLSRAAARHVCRGHTTPLMSTSRHTYIITKRNHPILIQRSNGRLYAAQAPVEATPKISGQEEDTGYRAYIDFKFVRDNLDLVKQNCADRLVKADPGQVVSLYDEFVQLTQEADAVRAARNENSSAMKQKLGDEERQALIAKGKDLKNELDSIDEKLNAIESALQVEGKRLPNLTHPDVPVGAEEHATVLKEVGTKHSFGFEPKDHVTLGENLGIVDFDTGSTVSGTKFYYLRKQAALLELALVQYAMQKIYQKGFEPMITPDLVRSSVMEKCGFQPRGEGTQVYSIAESQLCLTGTAEIPLGGVFMDQILSEQELPRKVAAFGRCFRTEAGAAGAAGKGLYRVHQFSKVEMFVICTPEQSEQLHQELMDIEVEMFEELGLHFKVLDMPSGDLGAPAYRKYDVEAWMPGLQRYGEISSASNCTDYQSRRLNIRYRPVSSDGDGASTTQEKKKKKNKKVPTQFVHTLNATACAVPRMIVAILESNQQEDGTIIIPEVLRPFMLGIDRISP
jgi:seryl-tRNA synthetase